MEDQKASQTIPASALHGRATDLDLWPVAIVEDRYSGSYSGGRWLAIGEADKRFGGRMRTSFILHEGPHGDDCEAMEFWLSPPDWIAVGNTPDQALAALRAAVTSPTAQSGDHEEPHAGNSGRAQKETE